MSDKVVLSVIEKFQKRSEAGQKKYGATLEREDLADLDWLNHAQEEAMDFVLYLEVLRKKLAARIDDKK